MQRERHVPLQGASNFRDFGGYAADQGRTVRWGRLFRSDKLSELTAADYQALGPLQIRFVYDLRRDSEAVKWPTVWQGEAPPELIRSPVFQDGESQNVLQRAAGEGVQVDATMTRNLMRDLYLRLVSEPGSLAALQRIFARLTAPDAFPALFHCAGGKDRTGVTCALILSTLGVAREDIVEDFMLTQKYFDATLNMERNIPQALAHAEGGGLSREALLPLFGVEQAYIETALDAVAAGGGVESFLRDELGVPPEGAERLREQLLA